jgi:uncharacterized protein YbcI
MSPSELNAERREIARGVVAIYKQHLGRGAVNARTLVSDNVVTVLCEGGMTLAERKLVADGRGDAVRSIRRELQAVMEDDIRALVERSLGRESASFLSDHDVERDIAIEVVVLKPS